MASGVILPLLVCFACGAGANGGATSRVLTEQVAELKQLVDSQQQRIRALSESADAPSLYGSPRDYTEEEKLGGALTHIWLVVCGALVVMTHMGFAMLHAGLCRMKNAQTVMINSLMSVCVATLAWWIFGFTFAFGLDSYDADGYKKNTFAGGFESSFGLGFMSTRDDGQQDPRFDMHTGSSPMALWFFQWALCTVAVHIASAGVAERANPFAYAIYAFVLALVIYPILAAWTWGKGWLSGPDVGTSFFDFAGGGVIHMTGGLGALVGAAIIKPRTGRWEDQETAGQRIKEYQVLFDPHSMPLVVLGTMVIWFGMYGLHCGATLSMNSIEKGYLAAYVAMNTSISAAAGGLTVFFIRLAMTKKFEITYMCNGILGGLAGIAAGCGNVESGTAFLIGIVSGLCFLGASYLLKVVKVDDPTDSFAVHGACGAWGLLAAGLFDWGKGFDFIGAWAGFKCVADSDGNCKTGMGGSLFGMNVLEILMVALWVVVLSLIVLFPLKLLNLLRADAPENEKLGIDDEKHVPKQPYNYEEGDKLAKPLKEDQI